VSSGQQNKKKQKQKTTHGNVVQVNVALFTMVEGSTKSTLVENHIQVMGKVNLTGLGMFLLIIILFPSSDEAHFIYCLTSLFR